MTPDRWQQISTLLDAVLAVPPAERQAYLAAHAPNDPALHAEVFSLIDAHEAAGGFLEEPAQDYAAALIPEPVGPARLIGQEIRGYRILSLLGEGGVGHVYKALHTRRGRLTALKFLHPHLRHDERSVLRFMAEAQAASALDHPNICRLYTIDEANDGRLFLAMAYYEGETLKKKIARGPLPIAQTLAYASQVAQGLSAAHASGIIHRDIKPANVLVTPEQVVKILDFGLAKMDHVHLTQTGRVMGTPAYMSPEHIQGERVGAQADVWSLGVVLYEMLAGSNPFRRSRDYEVIRAVLYDTPPPLRTIRPEISAPLERLVHQCLEKYTSLRFASADHLCAALQAM